MFSSWETEAAASRLADIPNKERDGSERRSGDAEADAGREEEARLQLLALFAAVAERGSGYEAGHQKEINVDGLGDTSSQTITTTTTSPSTGSTTDLLITGTLSESLLSLLAGQDLPYLQPIPVVSRDIAPTRKQLALARETKAPSTTSKGEERRTAAKGILCSVSVPYVKWLIPSSSPLLPPPPQDPEASGEEPNTTTTTLPPSYAFSPLHRTELAHVIARTAIPRTEATLATLGSVGVRFSPSPLESNPAYTSTSTSIPTSAAAVPAAATTSTDAASTVLQGAQSPTAEGAAAAEGGGNEGRGGDLIAWAFLGLDGSLTSLHVEPPHRGKGLAKAVCRRLFGRLREEGGEMGFRPLPLPLPLPTAVVRDGAEDEAAAGGEVSDGEEGLVHSDVAEGNVESAGVAKGLGGQVGWRVRWVGVDLGMVRDVVRGEEFA